MPSIITFEPAGNRNTASGSIAIMSPAPDEVIISSNGAFTFNAAVDNFAIGPLEFPSQGTPPCAIDPLGGRGGGQHIYLIVDNDYSFKVYGTPQQIILDDPSEGEHFVRAYLSRSWEECLKGSTEDEHFSVRRFYYGTKSSSEDIDRNIPLLSCNAPLGPEHGGPYRYDRVILDFFLMFGQLGNDYAVQVTLKDGTGTELAQGILTGWEPHCIKGLPQPAVNAIDIYHLTLRVVDGEENPIHYAVGNSDLNSIEREFHVVRELTILP